MTSGIDQVYRKKNKEKIPTIEKHLKFIKNIIF